MLRLLTGLFASLLAAVALVAPPAAAQSFLEGNFDPAIPTLEQVAGHRSGEQITRPEMVIAYMQALADAAPQRMRLVEYARSWEGRPLVYAVLARRTRSPQYVSRLIAKLRGSEATPDQVAAGAQIKSEEDWA